ncbi:MAG TPA: hypothetical protein VMD91_18535 [Candidatus Sulfotelmatobacter sp.]|nr:hypothetical protein [Candidatus Sulfotelmatobacter sp.]
MRFSLRNTIVTGALLAGAALAACSGGGSRAAVPTGAATNAPTTSSSKGNGLSGPLAKITITIPRHASFTHSKPAGTARAPQGVAARRAPKYVSPATQGLQITVSGNGTTQTVYADTSGSNCTNLTSSQTGNTTETCTIEVPVVAASETLTVDDVDVKPNDDGSSGNPPGYGDGFTGGHVLAVGTTTATLTAGQTTQISLVLGQVTGGFFDCGNLDASNSSNAGYDATTADETTATLPSGYNGDNSTALGRLVFTAGQPSWIQLVPELTDWDDQSQGFASPSPALVDVNASPAPVTVTTSLQHVGLAASNATAPLDPFNESQTYVPPPTPPPFASTTSSVSIGDQSYFWMFGYFPVIDVVYDGSTAAVAGTVNVNNNLTATDLFDNNPYTFVAPYTVAFVSASPTTLTLSLSTNPSAEVVGSDYQAALEGMTSISQPPNHDQTECETSGGVELASVTAGTMNTTTWQQPFTVTAMATGTCTFTLMDVITDVVSPPVTVTIGS